MEPSHVLSHRVFSRQEKNFLKPDLESSDILLQGYVDYVDFGHFDCKIGLLIFINLTKNPWDYWTRAQELTSGAIRMFLSFVVKSEIISKIEE